MKLKELTESANAASVQEEPAEPIDQSRPAAADTPSHLKSDEPEIAERLEQHPTGKAVYDLISRNDPKAFRFLQNRIRVFTWKIPPFDASDRESAVSEHVWDTILKKTKNDPRPEVVLRLAIEGKLDVLPYEVKMRFIDQARKASAQKRGGDGEHLPVFDQLGFDGEPMGRSDQDFDSSNGDAERRRQTGGLIEGETRDVWHRVTDGIWLKELASDSKIDELGPAGRLYRFYLEHPDARHWSDTEIAQELGVTDRTIRNHRPRVRRFVKQYL